MEYTIRAVYAESTPRYGVDVDDFCREGLMAEWGESFDVVIGDAPGQDEVIKSSIYATSLGAMYHGDSLQVLALPRVQKLKRKIQLVFTSPPFPLNTKKRYGNLKGEEYIEWFASFAPVLRDYLTKNGSI